MGELRSMPDGSKVWMLYTEYGKKDPPVDEVVSIEKIGVDYWESEPGPFQLREDETLSDDDDAVSADSQGETRLFKAAI